MAINSNMSPRKVGRPREHDFRLIGAMSSLANEVSLLKRRRLTPTPTKLIAKDNTSAEASSNEVSETNVAPVSLNQESEETMPKNKKPPTSGPIEYKQTNPKRKGSKVYERYEKYKNAKTVAAALKLGARMDDIKYDFKHGFLKCL